MKAQVAALDEELPLAAKIADMSRHGRCPPCLLAIGHPSLHQAIKVLMDTDEVMLSMLSRLSISRDVPAVMLKAR